MLSLEAGWGPQAGWAQELPEPEAHVSVWGVASAGQGRSTWPLCSSLACLGGLIWPRLGEMVLAPGLAPSHPRRGIFSAPQLPRSSQLPQTLGEAGVLRGQHHTAGILVSTSALSGHLDNPFAAQFSQVIQVQVLQLGGRTWGTGCISMDLAFLDTWESE